MSELYVELYGIGISLMPISTQKHIAGRISEAAMGGAGAGSAPICVLMSL
jgi:hypothetical protein